MCLWGGGGGVTTCPGDVNGHGAGFVNFCCQFLPGDKGIVFLLYLKEPPGTEPWDLPKYA